MIVCPTCGRDSAVLETRDGPHNQVRRRRECLDPACRMKFTTVELVIAGIRKHPGLVTTISRRDLEEVARLVNNALGQEGTTQHD